MSYLVKTKTWFDGMYGNTYHRVVILNDDFEEIADSGMEYGYDRQYEQTAIKIFQKLGIIPKDEKCNHIVFEKYKIEFAAVEEVKTQRKLEA